MDTTNFHKDSIAFYPIPKLAALIKGKRLSCVALTKFYLARLKTMDQSYHVPLP